MSGGRQPRRGDVVETVAQLEALPDAAVLRSGPQRTVFEKIGTRWYAPGVGRALMAPGDFLPAHVLDLPEDGQRGL